MSNLYLNSQLFKVNFNINIDDLKLLHVDTPKYLMRLLIYYLNIYIQIHKNTAAEGSALEMAFCTS